MGNEEYNSTNAKKFLSMQGVDINEKLHFYYDESNNCRKFWLDSSKKDFNSDFRADFVLAGVASEKEFQISFEELKERFRLQNNVTELKSKSMFRGKDFLQCLGTKQLAALIQLFSDYDLYLHYLHVNNFYYTIVEILDSITTPAEIYDFGFDYFMLKTTMYNMLFPNIDKVTQIMIKYEYPNIKTEMIEQFCTALIDAIDTEHRQKIDEKFILGMLKRASQSSELLFIQDNKDFVMQEDYSFFYADPILKYQKSVHHFDEEKQIQGKVKEYVLKYNGVSNYEFINSKENTMVQISDLVSGVLAKMFTFINTTYNNDLREIVKGLNDTQITNCISFNALRFKSDRRNKGLLHSITAIGVLDRLNWFFGLVEREQLRRSKLKK